MFLRVAPLLFAIACERDAGNACVAVGDPRLAIELLPVAVNDAGALVPLHDGDGLLLQKPPQGGYVIYAGAAARNLQACGAQVTAYLIDRASGKPLTNLDQRKTDFTVENGGYFFTSSPYSQTPNIPACPDALRVGVLGADATLHVEVLDAQSRSAAVEVRVHAACPAGDVKCPCLCGSNPTGC